jgi:hypothetical protein
MLPDESRISSTERSAVLQLCANADAGDKTARNKSDDPTKPHRMSVAPQALYEYH